MEDCCSRFNNDPCAEAIISIVPYNLDFPGDGIADYFLNNIVHGFHLLELFNDRCKRFVYHLFKLLLLNLHSIPDPVPLHTDQTQQCSRHDNGQNPYQLSAHNNTKIGLLNISDSYLTIFNNP